MRSLDVVSRGVRTLAERTYAERLRREVLAKPVPRHVAVIMDGNRRHAKGLGLAPTEGHLLGSQTLENLLEWCRRVGVRVLTVYALSTENLHRTHEEVEVLMRLFERKLDDTAKDPRVHDNRVRVRIVGRTDLLPAHVVDAIRRVEEATKDYDRFEFRVCIAYGARQEIVDAVRRIAEQVRDGTIEPDSIDEKTITDHLVAGGDEPDLLIRTGGEIRLSNFLLYQAAYSELVFTDVHFPAFREIDFLRIVRTFQQRTRRFGK